MPLYPCKCKQCGHEEDVLLPVERYKELPDHCGEQMSRVFTPLTVIEDMKPYKSPLDGTWVTSRTEHKNHMKKHDVIEVGNEKLTRPMQKENKVDGLADDIKKTMHDMGV